MLIWQTPTICRDLDYHHSSDVHHYMWDYSKTFSYCSLLLQLPEINNVGGGDPLHEDQRSIKIFLIQNAGLLTGFGLMLVLALFAGNISFWSKLHSNLWTILLGLGLETVSLVWVSSPRSCYSRTLGSWLASALCWSWPYLQETFLSDHNDTAMTWGNSLRSWTGDSSVIP